MLNLGRFILFFLIALYTYIRIVNYYLLTFIIYIIIKEP
jgi:hypothetical protein